MHGRRISAVWTTAILLIAVSLAHGQSDEARSEADRLFREGRELIEAGKYPEACERFERSVARDPRQVGALLNLGLCNEKQGKTATALRYYRQTLAAATDSGSAKTRDHSADRIRVLERDVPVLIFTHEAEPVAGERLLVDDRVVAVDEELTVDPGKHTVVLTAPDRVPYETSVTVKARERRSIELPALAQPTDRLVTKQPSTRRTVGKALTIAGTATVLAAGGLGFYARRDYDGLFEGVMPHCGRYPDVAGTPACDEYGLSRSERDRSLLDGAGVIGALGLATLVTGVVLWVTAPTETSTTVVVPTADETGAGVLVQRRF
jgi:hypothetical protein